MNKALSYEIQGWERVGTQGSNYLIMNMIHYKHIESQKKMLLYRYIVTIIILSDFTYIQRFRSWNGSAKSSSFSNL